jgi:hypothetical protein
MKINNELIEGLKTRIMKYPHHSKDKLNTLYKPKIMDYGFALLDYLNVLSMTTPGMERIYQEINKKEYPETEAELSFQKWLNSEDFKESCV